MTLMALGSVIVRLGNPPTIYGTGRVCEHVGCYTNLSQYNKGGSKGPDYCWHHSPAKHSRVRGRSPSELMSKKSNVVNHCKMCLHQDGATTKILVNGIVHVKGEYGGADCEE